MKSKIKAPEDCLLRTARFINSYLLTVSSRDRGVRELSRASLIRVLVPLTRVEFNTS